MGREDLHSDMPVRRSIHQSNSSALSIRVELTRRTRYRPLDACRSFTLRCCASLLTVVFSLSSSFLSNAWRLLSGLWPASGIGKTEQRKFDEREGLDLFADCRNRNIKAVSNNNREYIVVLYYTMDTTREIRRRPRNSHL